MTTETTAPFNVDCTGDLTGISYVGTFRAKKLLSHAERLRQDARRRELLGSARPDEASDYAKTASEAFSQLEVRLTEAPQFWKDNGMGLGLVDENIVIEVYTGAMKVESDHIAEMKKAAEAAKAKLQQPINPA